MPRPWAAPPRRCVAPEIARRADRLAGAPNEEFVLSTDGQLRWRGEVVAALAEGDSLYAPRLIVLADESLTGPDLERVQDRLMLWLRHHINTVLEPVLALEAPADLEGAARGLAYRLYENLGLMPRGPVAEEVKGLDQDVRAKLRKLGVKFGAYHVYVPLALKPAPRELALVLLCAQEWRRAPARRQRTAADGALGKNIVPGRPRDFDQALRGRGLQGRRQARRARRHSRASRRSSSGR